MQITFARDGGLAYMPGLAKELTIDVDQLPQAEALEIHELVAAAHFFERPQQPEEPGADRRSYRISITDGKLSRLLVVIPPIEDEDLRNLVQLLEEKARVSR